MEKIDPYRLITIGKIKEAISLLTAEINKQPEVYHYNNRATAYLLNGEVEKSLKDSINAEALENDVSDNYFHFRSMLYWLKNEKDKSIQLMSEVLDLHKKRKIQYSVDLGGGISTALLLWFYSTSVADDRSESKAIDFIKTNWSKKKFDESWYKQIAQYILNAINGEEVLKRVQSEYESIQVNTSSENKRMALENIFTHVYFYFAAKKRNEGNVEEGKKYYLWCVNSGRGKYEPTYFLALNELGLFNRTDH
jgi:hypothetical protein